MQKPGMLLFAAVVTGVSPLLADTAIGPTVDRECIEPVLACESVVFGAGASANPRLAPTNVSGSFVSFASTASVMTGDDAESRVYRSGTFKNLSISGLPFLIESLFTVRTPSGPGAPGGKAAITLSGGTTNFTPLDYPLAPGDDRFRVRGSNTATIVIDTTAGALEDVRDFRFVFHPTNGGGGGGGGAIPEPGSLTIFASGLAAVTLRLAWRRLRRRGLTGSFPPA